MLIKKYKIFKNLNESKLNGKYGFFMFLNIIDLLNNAFINKDYLNTKNFNIFFKTNKIKDKNKLTDLLEYKSSLNISYSTLIHIRNLRLSFYFGVRNGYYLEYGFHDDLKNIIYKTGEFKITSIFLKQITESYKSIVLISNILNNINLKNLKLLQNIKNDIIYLFDIKFNNIEIKDNNKIIKTINNIELKNYFNNGDIRLFFDKWCFNYKWYYSIYNYIDSDDNNTYFIIKLKETDNELNFLKKNYDINKIKENKDESSFSDMIPRTNVLDPITTEPLNAPKLKIINKKSSKDIFNKEKELIKYFKDLKKVLININKDNEKNKSYITKYLYSLVGKYKKPFNDVKKDLYWLKNKLNNDINFIDNEEIKLKNKIKKKSKK